MNKILVANRGEIAVRVMRTCRELGIPTVAVYSEADETALHVRMADEAVAIGPAPSSESYLVHEKILDAASQTGTDAIHPGYGFLSENATFATACEEAGVTFIGPPAKAIAAMGDKTKARALMREAGVPMAPGTPDAIDDPAEAENVAGEIGYPVLVKAAAGGGGKGMRIVEDEKDFKRAFDGARSEAKSAFGDDRVYIEKFFVGPRHIEFQILADGHGNVVHLFERECSIQRRHQKVIEEAPSAVLTPALRDEMGEAAVNAARACGYVGAGTIEFLLDADHHFYFLEMNTRLQVEHPVTEWITGIDLVAEQIRIASGEPLGYKQEDLSINGHAVECRVYAEDVAAGFLPDPGPLLRHRPPSGFGTRVDAGVEEGDVVPVHYDPMISKLTTWSRSRNASPEPFDDAQGRQSRREALDRMDRALSEYDVAGVQTTIPFCRFVMSHPAFRQGDFDTGFIDNHFTPEILHPDEEQIQTALLATALTHTERPSINHKVTTPPPASSRWARRRWEAGGP